MTEKKVTPAQKRKQKRLYIILVGLVFLAAGAFLVLRAFQSNVMFFVTPSDITQMELTGKEQFRLGGLVEFDSVKRAPDGLEVDFIVTDGGASIPVHYEGLLPDLFKEGQGVVTEGVIDADGIFQARTVLAKHDEKYMPPEVAEALKKQGHWMDENGYGDQTDQNDKDDGSN